MSRSMRSEASSLHASEPVVSTDHLAATGLGEAEVPSGRRQQSKEPLFPRGDVCCSRQQTGDFCADPISSIQAVRQLPAGKSGLATRSSSGSPRGGGTVENFDSNGCAHGAREAGRRRRYIASCVEKRTGGRPQRVGESARTRWSCRGSARPPNLQARR